MKTQVKALVVGGGAVGVSIAYHLARAGWNDVMLIERDELTSGSTWHAAGLLPLFNMSYATTHIHKYSVDFYKTLEEETGLDPARLELEITETTLMGDTEMIVSELTKLRNLGVAIAMDDFGTG